MRAAPLAGGGWPPGALLSGELPVLPGWHALRQRRVLPADRWELAASTLLGWRMHLGAGVGVRTDADPLDVGTVAVLRIGPLTAPVRVLAVERTADRVGFSYGTLPGHPEAGEEAFVLERGPQGCTATVVALSRPASWLTRAGGPVARAAQRVAARRYLRVLTGRG
nr:DUF1990 domain-containing protein [Auraticoccus cholistanensis]